MTYFSCLNVTEHPHAEHVFIKRHSDAFVCRQEQTNSQTLAEGCGLQKSHVERRPLVCRFLAAEYDRPIRSLAIGLFGSEGKRTDDRSGQHQQGRINFVLQEYQ